MVLVRTGAQPGPYTVLASGNWSSWPGWPWDGPGEVKGAPRKWYNGANVWGFQGDHVCGTPQQFMAGLDRWPKPEEWVWCCAAWYSTPCVCLFPKPAPAVYVPAVSYALPEGAPIAPAWRSLVTLGLHPGGAPRSNRIRIFRSADQADAVGVDRLPLPLADHARRPDRPRAVGRRFSADQADAVGVDRLPLPLADHARRPDRPRAVGRRFSADQADAVGVDRLPLPLADHARRPDRPRAVGRRFSADQADAVGVDRLPLPLAGCQRGTADTKRIGREFRGIIRRRRFCDHALLFVADASRVESGLDDFGYGRAERHVRAQLLRGRTGMDHSAYRSL